MASKAVYCVLLAALLLRFPKKGAKVLALIVFGDSSVDTGNNNQLQTIAKSNFPPYGRDLGGSATAASRQTSSRRRSGFRPIVPAYLDPTYSIKDFVMGVCFASSGTGYDNATVDSLSVLSLSKQLEYFKKYQGELRTRARYSNGSLIHSCLGTNDIHWTYYGLGGRSTAFSIQQYQIFLIGIAEGFMTELYRLGARKITLGGIPPIGCFPLERTRSILVGGGCIEQYNKVAREFIEKLQVLITKLNIKLTGIQLVISKAYNILLQMIRNPGSFGFKNAEAACCGTGLVEMGYLCDRAIPLTCSDANLYVFWDPVHPTERGYSIIADYTIKTYLSRFF